MKTAEIKPLVTYSFRENSYGSAGPVMVVEKGLWTEKNEWFPGETNGRQERRIIRRSEKGVRAGTRNSWGSSYHKTGIPVLKLNTSEGSFLMSADPEHRITDTPHELLTRAMEKLQLLDLVDSEQSVFEIDEEGQTHRKTRTTVMAQFADGHTDEISVHMELVRPQNIITGWAEHLEQVEKEAVRKADLARKTSERKAENDKTAWSIRDRVGALLDDSDQQLYNSRDERYDVHREWTSSGISSKYEISEAMLLKLLALAEKGAAQ